MPYKNTKMTKRGYPGDGYYYVICDRCGLERRRKECLMTWDKLLVCQDRCFEQRHPQDILPAPRGSKSPTITRPEQADSFIQTTVNPEDL